ncbi:MAG: peptide deformylase [Verrucomicrobiota bacterium]|nr:peptide deformylase [Verrucomicrobiota bacterium]
MLLRVTQFGEPVLREVGKPVENFDASLKQLTQDMLETMYASKGVGIAAQQVGHALQLCVIDLQARGADVDFDYDFDGKKPPLDLLMPLVVANPELKLGRSPLSIYEEGCLSFQGIRGDIERPERVTLTYQDVSGVKHVLKATGFLSRVIQHEYDHLQGILFTDRMDASVKRELKPVLATLKATAKELMSEQKLKPKF